MAPKTPCRLGLGLGAGLRRRRLSPRTRGMAAASTLVSPGDLADDRDGAKSFVPSRSRCRSSAEAALHYLARGAMGRKRSFETSRNGVPEGGSNPKQTNRQRRKAATAANDKLRGIFQTDEFDDIEKLTDSDKVPYNKVDRIKRKNHLVDGELMQSASSSIKRRRSVVRRGRLSSKRCVQSNVSGIKSPISEEIGLNSNGGGGNKPKIEAESNFIPNMAKEKNEINKQTDGKLVGKSTDGSLARKGESLGKPGQQTKRAENSNDAFGGKIASRKSSRKCLQTQFYHLEYDKECVKMLSSQTNRTKLIAARRSGQNQSSQLKRVLSTTLSQKSKQGGKKWRGQHSTSTLSALESSMIPTSDKGKCDNMKSQVNFFSHQQLVRELSKEEKHVFKEKSSLNEKNLVEKSELTALSDHYVAGHGVQNRPRAAEKRSYAKSSKEAAKSDIEFNFGTASDKKEMLASDPSKKGISDMQSQSVCITKLLLSCLSEDSADKELQPSVDGLIPLPTGDGSEPVASFVTVPNRDRTSKSNSHRGCLPAKSAQKEHGSLSASSNDLPEKATISVANSKVQIGLAFPEVDVNEGKAKASKRPWKKGLSIIRFENERERKLELQEEPPGTKQTISTSKQSEMKLVANEIKRDSTAYPGSKRSEVDAPQKGDPAGPQPKLAELLLPNPPHPVPTEGINSWICDVCQHATFENYEDALSHERECVSMKQTQPKATKTYANRTHNNGPGDQKFEHDGLKSLPVSEGTTLGHRHSPNDEPINSWTCDICHDVTFKTHEEALAHEKVCASRSCTRAIKSGGCGTSEDRGHVQPSMGSDEPARGSKLHANNSSELIFKPQMNSKSCGDSDGATLKSCNDTVADKRGCVDSSNDEARISCIEDKAQKTNTPAESAKRENSLNDAPTLQKPYNCSSGINPNARAGPPMCIINNNCADTIQFPRAVLQHDQARILARKQECIQPTPGQLRHHVPFLPLFSPLRHKSPLQETNLLGSDYNGLHNKVQSSSALPVRHDLLHPSHMNATNPPPTATAGILMSTVNLNVALPAAALPTGVHIAGPKVNESQLKLILAEKQCQKKTVELGRLNLEDQMLSQRMSEILQRIEVIGSISSKIEKMAHHWTPIFLSTQRSHSWSPHNESSQGEHIHTRNLPRSRRQRQGPSKVESEEVKSHLTSNRQDLDNEEGSSLESNKVSLCSVESHSLLGRQRTPSDIIHRSPGPRKKVRGDTEGNSGRKKSALKLKHTLRSADTRIEGEDQYGPAVVQKRHRDSRCMFSSPSEKRSQKSLEERQHSRRNCMYPNQQSSTLNVGGYSHNICAGSLFIEESGQHSRRFRGASHHELGGNLSPNDRVQKCTNECHAASRSRRKLTPTHLDSDIDSVAPCKLESDDHVAENLVLCGKRYRENHRNDMGERKEFTRSDKADFPKSFANSTEKYLKYGKKPPGKFSRRGKPRCSIPTMGILDKKCEAEIAATLLEKAPSKEEQVSEANRQKPILNTDKNEIKNGKTALRLVGRYWLDKEGTSSDDESWDFDGPMILPPSPL